MHKLLITIDIGKLKKERVHTRKYTNSAGEEVTVREYRLEAVPLREPKTLKTGDTYELQKTHFIAEATTKEERENGYKGAILGDGLYFRNRNVEQDNGDGGGAYDEYAQEAGEDMP